MIAESSAALGAKIRCAMRDILVLQSASSTGGVV
jgi:hypothetical protein